MEAKLKPDELRRKVEEIKAGHRELEKLIPLHTPKQKKRVAKSELWSRGEREELSKLAEEFLRAKPRQP